MKRFQFRLEQVRKWRQNQAELEEMRLERLHNELHSLEAAQREIATATERSRRTVLAQPAVTSEELGSLESLHEYAQHETRRLKGREQEVKGRVIEQRQRVLEAHRRFELLEGLHDKALAGWVAARDKEDEELGAELFLSKLARNPRPGT